MKDVNLGTYDRMSTDGTNDDASSYPGLYEYDNAGAENERAYPFLSAMDLTERLSEASFEDGMIDIGMSPNSQVPTDNDHGQQPSHHSSSNDFLHGADHSHDSVQGNLSRAGSDTTTLQSNPYNNTSENMPFPSEQWTGDEQRFLSNIHHHRNPASNFVSSLTQTDTSDVFQPTAGIELARAVLKLLHTAIQSSAPVDVSQQTPNEYTGNTLPSVSNAPYLPQSSFQQTAGTDSLSINTTSSPAGTDSLSINNTSSSSAGTDSLSINTISSFVQPRSVESVNAEVNIDNLAPSFSSEELSSVMSENLTCYSVDNFLSTVDLSDALDDLCSNYEDLPQTSSIKHNNRLVNINLSEDFATTCSTISARGTNTSNTGNEHEGLLPICTMPFAIASTIRKSPVTKPIEEADGIRSLCLENEHLHRRINAPSLPMNSYTLSNFRHTLKPATVIESQGRHGECSLHYSTVTQSETTLDNLPSTPLLCSNDRQMETTSTGCQTFTETKHGNACTVYSHQSESVDVACANSLHQIESAASAWSDCNDQNISDSVSSCSYSYLQPIETKKQKQLNPSVNQLLLQSPESQTHFLASAGNNSSSIIRFGSQHFYEKDDSVDLLLSPGDLTPQTSLHGAFSRSTSEVSQASEFSLRSHSDTWDTTISELDSIHPSPLESTVTEDEKCYDEKEGLQEFTPSNLPGLNVTENLAHVVKQRDSVPAVTTSSKRIEGKSHDKKRKRPDFVSETFSPPQAKSPSVSSRSDSIESRSDSDLGQTSNKRERNKLAAQRCRRKQMEKVEKLEKQVDRLSNKQDRIKSEIAKLSREKEDLHTMLKDHLPSCQLDKKE